MMADPIEPERAPFQQGTTFDTGERNGTWMGPLPVTVPPDEARRVMLEWSDGRCDPGPAGVEFSHFSAKWGRRVALWRLGPDGNFHLERDEIVEDEP